MFDSVQIIEPSILVVYDTIVVPQVPPVNAPVMATVIAPSPSSSFQKQSAKKRASVRFRNHFKDTELRQTFLKRKIGPQGPPNRHNLTRRLTSYKDEVRGP